MKYLKFRIANYRAITGPLEIDVRRNSLLPIIGVNESGKTTILHAVFAFDHFNDELNVGRHLQDIANLYEVSPHNPQVSAYVQITWEEFLKVLKKVGRASDTTRVKAKADTSESLIAE